MTNQPPPAALRVILDDLSEEGARIVLEDDIYTFDDEMEELLPQVARRILQVTNQEPHLKYDALIVYLDVIAHFVTNPDTLPPLPDHDEEG